MKEQIETLIKLQKIETESGRIRAKLREMPDKLEGLKARVNECEQQIADKTAEMNELEKKNRSDEREVKDNTEKINKSQARLGTIKSNKEYQALLKEIEGLKAKNSRIEDEMLACLDRIEEIKKEIGAKEAEFSKLEIQVQKDKETLERQANKEEKKLADLDTKWQAASEKVSPDLLDKFETIKQRNAGIAVVPVINSICKGCNMNIPPQMYNDLYHCNSLTYCPNCQRIIYWEKPSIEN
jgi:hypothetical protein